jgi:hypothetical protein
MIVDDSHEFDGLVTALKPNRDVPISVIAQRDFRAMQMLLPANGLRVVSKGAHCAPPSTSETGSTSTSSLSAISAR